MYSVYRENINDVISATGERISTLIVPTNRRLKAYTWKVLGEAGLNLDEATQTAEDTLQVGGLKLVLRRGERIPEAVTDYAKKGEVVLGITGDDLYDEFRLQNPNNILKLENTYDWYDEKARFLRPALCFINRTGQVEELSPENEDIDSRPRIEFNAKYFNTISKYVEKIPLIKELGKWPNLLGTTSQVEREVSDGRADYAIDIVYTGKTIDELNLKIIEIIRFSDLAVISPLKNGPTLEALANQSD